MYYDCHVISAWKPKWFKAEACNSLHCYRTMCNSAISPYMENKSLITGVIYVSDHMLWPSFQINLSPIDIDMILIWVNSVNHYKLNAQTGILKHILFKSAIRLISVKLKH